jgi:hypothetical protein
MSLVEKNKHCKVVEGKVACDTLIEVSQDVYVTFILRQNIPLIWLNCMAMYQYFFSTVF